jgi:hypothetical protein
MSATSEVTNKEVNAFKSNNATPSKSSNMQILTITDPIDLTNIKAPTNSSTMSSIVKAAIIFAATLGGYYLAKTTGVFSYFKSKEKNLNSKNVDNSEVNKRNL